MGSEGVKVGLKHRGVADSVLGENFFSGRSEEERVYRRTMKGIQVYYEGRVQGVGFRYCVRQLACGYEVTGWVKNLPDGRVELQASGEPEELEHFLESIRESELKGHIRKEERHQIAAFFSKGFEIQR